MVAIRETPLFQYFHLRDQRSTALRCESSHLRCCLRGRGFGTEVLNTLILAVMRVMARLIRHLAFARHCQSYRSFTRHPAKICIVQGQPLSWGTAATAVEHLESVPEGMETRQEWTICPGLAALPGCFFKRPGAEVPLPPGFRTSGCSFKSCGDTVATGWPAHCTPTVSPRWRSCLLWAFSCVWVLETGFGRLGSLE